MREASPAAPLGPVLTTSLRTQSLMETLVRDSILEAEVRATIPAEDRATTPEMEGKDTILEVRDTILEVRATILEVIPATL